MKRSEMLFGVLRIPSDAIAVACASLLAYRLREQSIDLIPGVQILEPAKTLPGLNLYTHEFVIPTVLLFILIAALLKLYLIRVTLSAFRELARIALSTVVWVGFIMGWYFFVQKELFYSRAILIHATFFVALFVSIGRILLTIFQRSLLRKGIGVRSVMSIGTQPLPEVVAQFMENDPRYKYVGQKQSLDEIDAGVGARHAVPLQERIDLILHTDPSSTEQTNRIIDYCRSHQIGYAFLPPVLQDVPHLLSVYRFGSVPILRFHPTPLDGWGAVYKRISDWMIACVLLAALFPTLAIIALVIKLDSRGPVFYVSRRIGQGGARSIGVLKFRSMVQDADARKQELSEQSHRDGPLFKIKDDPRVTRVGKLLRRWSLDELPQLWNVIRGDLSMIGPRPHLPEEVEKYTEFQRRVFTVKPGITGLAQISGRSDLPFEEEVRLDLQYIEEWSPFLDCFIFWRTVCVVLRGEGAD